MRKLLLPAMFIALVALTYAYLYPGSEAMIDQRTDIVMSDDTDGATLPYVYDSIIQTFKEHPSRLFFGAVYMDRTNPEYGVAGWHAWNERWLLLAASPFFVIEQLPTAVVFLILLLNALAMYALCRYLKWNRSVAAGLALAWAFCPFTRARAKVHMTMAGTYHLPLIFLGLYLVVRGKGHKSLIAAAAAFLLAATVVHYFIVTAMFLSPLFLLFIALQPETRAQWKRIALRTVLAVLPMVIFLGFNFFVPVPPGARLAREKAFPTGGEYVDGKTHPFLYAFAAHPLDFLGGDIALHESAQDTNPLREQVNEYILKNLGNGNSHERTNGIRWLVLIFAVAALVTWGRGKYRDAPQVQAGLLFFLIFAVATFWLSQSPDFPFPRWGLSYWMHELISQVRVPSRAGINVHFAALMLTGFFLTSNLRWRKWVLLPGVFPLLMIAGYPPLVQNMPMAPMRPAYSALQRSHGACGAGFYFPFSSNYALNEMNYRFVQRMRESDCTILNIMPTPKRIQYMLTRFPPDMAYLNQLATDEATPRNLELLARCVPLTWLAFDPAVPEAWVQQMCRRLGWTLNPDMTCIAPDKTLPLQRFPDECG